jgi:F-type H+-transporting ATPase subunit a
MIASGFSWFTLVPGVEDHSLFPFAHDHGYAFVTAWFVCLVLVAFAAYANLQLKKATSREGLERYQADEKLSARTMAEVFVAGISGIMGDLMERDDVRRFLPLIGGLFAYIFVSNILAILPGFQPPTDNINTNVGMAIIVMVTYWAVGLTRDAKGFFKHLLGPVPVLAPLILALELMTLLLVRPASLSVRLSGNIFGDHTVFNIMSGLVPAFLPVIFLALAMLVSVIQAFVFSLLTTIYISQSLPHGDHDHDHAHH